MKAGICFEVYYCSYFAKGVCSSRFSVLVCVSSNLITSGITLIQNSKRTVQKINIEILQQDTRHSEKKRFQLFDQ